jgi:formate dehydrogenase subunit gamma
MHRAPCQENRLAGCWSWSLEGLSPKAVFDGGTRYALNRRGANSLRRKGEETYNPDYTEFAIPAKMPQMNSMWNEDRAAVKIGELAHLPGALLPILHALQEAFGYVDKAAIPLIADALNISHAEVHGVISFYRDFRATPPGRHILKMCRAEACQSMDCDTTIRHVEGRLGVRLGETTEDASFTLEAVYCLGLCALSPAVMLDGKPYGRVSSQIADFLIDSLQRRA